MEDNETRNRSLEEMESERFEWSKSVFTHATALSSIEKLKEEIKEVQQLLSVEELARKTLTDVFETLIAEEYADCLMCLFDSAARAGITVKDINVAFETKLAKNKARGWVRNADNTYSHIKS